MWQQCGSEKKGAWVGHLVVSKIKTAASRAEAQDRFAQSMQAASTTFQPSWGNGSARLEKQSEGEVSGEGSCEKRGGARASGVGARRWGEARDEPRKARLKCVSE